MYVPSNWNERNIKLAVHSKNRIILSVVPINQLLGKVKVNALIIP